MPANGGAPRLHESQTPPTSRGSAQASAFESQLEEARREVARLQAQQQSATQAAFAQGVEEGKRLAAGDTHQQVEALRRQVAQSLSSIEQARAQLLAQTDRDLVRLSVAIAEKVLNRQVQVDPDALCGVARAALDRLGGKTALLVRVHPDDHAALSAQLAGLAAKGTRLVADGNLARGSLIVETEYGNLDCSLSTQLEEIERGLVDRLQRSQP